MSLLFGGIGSSEPLRIARTFNIARDMASIVALSMLLQVWCGQSWCRLVLPKCLAKFLAAYNGDDRLRRLDACEAEGPSHIVRKARSAQPRHRSLRRDAALCSFNGDGKDESSVSSLRYRGRGRHLRATRAGRGVCAVAHRPEAVGGRGRGRRREAGDREVPPAHTR